MCHRTTDEIQTTDARPISTWPDKDEAWTNVVTDIRRALEPSSKSTEAISPEPQQIAPSVPHTCAPSLSTLEQRNRAHFLAKLHNSYRDRLTASLQGAAQIVPMSQASMVL
jgi:hypothetical protein